MADKAILLPRKTRKQASTARLVVLMVVVLALQVIVALGQGLSVLYVEIIRVFGTSRTLAALVQSTFIGVNHCAGLLWTPVINRFGTGMSIALGACIATIGLLASAFASNVYVIIILTGILGGFGMSAPFIGSLLTAGLAFHNHRSAAVALSTTGVSLGMFAFPSVTNYFLEGYGLSGTFILEAGVALNVTVLALVVHFSQDFFDNGQEQCTGNAAPFDIKLFKNMDFLIVLFLAILVGFFGMIEHWFLVDLLMSRGYSRDTGSLFTSLLGLVNMVGRLYGTCAGLCKRVHLLIHATYSFALVALAHGLVLYLMDYDGLLAATCLYGFSFGVVVATLPGIYIEVLGIQHFAQAYGSRNVCHGVGIFFGGLLGGYINDVTGSYNLLFLIAMGSMAFAGLSFFALFIKMRVENCNDTDFSKKSLSTSMTSLKLDETDNIRDNLK